MDLAQRATILTPSLTLSIDSKAKAMKAEGIDVCGFGAGEPDFDTPAHVTEAGIQALRDGYTHYVPALGIPQFRDPKELRLDRMLLQPLRKNEGQT